MKYIRYVPVNNGLALFLHDINGKQLSTFIHSNCDALIVMDIAKNTVTHYPTNPHEDVYVMPINDYIEHTSPSILRGNR